MKSSERRGMLPLSNGAAAVVPSAKAELAGASMRWLVSLLLLFAVTIPCTVFLQSAGTAQVPLLTSINVNVRPDGNPPLEPADAAAVVNVEKPQPAADDASVVRVEQPQPAAGAAAVVRVEQPQPAAGDAAVVRVEQPQPAAGDAPVVLVEQPQPAAGDAAAVRVEQPQPAAGDAAVVLVEQPQPAAGDATVVRVEQPQPAAGDAAVVLVEQPKPAAGDAAVVRVEQPQPAAGDAAVVRVEQPQPASSAATVPRVEQPAASSASPSPLVEMEGENVRLAKVLKAAATKNRTVIVTTLNAAWAAPGSMMDLFLESFRIGNGTQELLKHLVIVALDQKAYERCRSVHRHCFALVTEGVDFSGEKLFMTDGYLQLVWRKLDVLRMVLGKGYNFIFSDMDVMWFRNPFPKLYPDADFQTSCDEFFGDPSDLNNQPNTGFKYVKANNRSVAFYNYWYESRTKFPGTGQQGVFNSIKFDPYMKEIGVKIKFLSTDNFGGMCHMSNDVSKAYTIHTNCCVGLTAKLHDLRVLLEDWRKYMSLSPSTREGRTYMWSELQFQCG